jgi:hypothetical protein
MGGDSDMKNKIVIGRTLTAFNSSDGRASNDSNFVSTQKVTFEKTGTKNKK